MINPKILEQLPPHLRNNLFMFTRTGSKAYGVDIPESDDDFIGVYIESPEEVFSIGKPKVFTGDNVVFTTVGKERITSFQNGEFIFFEMQIFPLRRFAEAALKGNPTIWPLLFANSNHIDPDVQEEMVNLFVSKRNLHACLGVMRSQALSLCRNFCPKKAYQTLAFGIMGSELGYTGGVTFPLSADNVEYLQAVRAGDVSGSLVMTTIDLLIREIESLLDLSYLPEQVDSMKVAQWVGRVHREHWDRLEP